MKKGVAPKTTKKTLADKKDRDLLFRDAEEEIDKIRRENKEAIKRKARTITLEVQSSNLSAQALYKKYGFIELGVRKNYYSKNENALILTTPNINLDNFKDLLFKSFEAYKFRFNRKTVDLIAPLEPQ